MRLHVLSDLHFDVRRDDWRAFAGGIPKDLGDVLVLAGDVLCLNDEAAPEMLATLRAKAPEVVYVLGNHEHYHGAFGETKQLAAAVCQQAGVVLLDDQVATLAGRRFVGSTLWFRRDEAAQPHRHLLTDFHVIAGFEPAVYEDNRRALAFLRAEIEPGDLVITHHLPSQASVPRRFRRGRVAALNSFFVCDCDDIIHDRRPALWIHGHTHDPCDHQVGETRVVCNPIGYPREGQRGRLDFVVDVPDLAV
jgi:predicted MPP superfamily phosphohydrolase